MNVSQLNYSIVFLNIILFGMIVPANSQKHDHRDGIFKCHMKTSNKKGNITPYEERHWPGSIIYYQKNITHPLKNRILSAMEHVSSRTNLCFQEAEGNQYRLEFIEHGITSGGTFVGYWPEPDGSGIHQVWLGSQILEEHIIHELLHTAGLFHEHNRQDRETYITVHEGNLVDGGLGQYTIEGQAHGAYDFLSVMHYPPEALAQGGPAFTLRPGYQQYEGIVGNATQMSNGDIQAINYIYQNPCSSSCTTCGVDLIADCNTIFTFLSGDQIQISNLEIFNNGNQQSIAYQIGYFLSPTNSLSNATLIGTQQMGALNSGGSITAPPTSFDISSIPNESNYLITLVDPPNLNTDINTINNLCYGQELLGSDCTAVDGQNIAGFYASEHIFSAPNYLLSPASGSQCITGNGANLLITAGGFVDLNPGFRTETGAVFTAEITDCTSVNDLLVSDQQEVVNYYTINTEELLLDSVPEYKSDINDDAYINVSPNPMSSESVINYKIPTSSEVKIALFNVQGKKIIDLLSSSWKAKGPHQFKFNNPNLNSGLYIIRLRYSNKNTFQKLLIN